MKYFLFLSLILVFVYSCKKEDTTNKVIIPTDGLIVSYNFDNNLQDNSSSKNDAIIFGNYNYYNGLFNKALQFQYLNYLKFTSEPQIDNRNYTFLVWVKTPFIHSLGMTIFQHGFFQDSVECYGMILYLDYNNELTFECRNGTYSKYMKSGYVSVDNWHLLALKCERNGNNENYSMYLDGIYVKNINIPKNFIVLNPNYDNSYTSGRNINIAIDGNHLTKLLQFNGMMDQLKIYNRALSADEIKSIYDEN